jgi:hypothetical protein
MTLVFPLVYGTTGHIYEAVSKDLLVGVIAGGWLSSHPMQYPLPVSVAPLIVETWMPWYEHIRAPSIEKFSVTQSLSPHNKWQCAHRNQVCTRVIEGNEG